MFCRIWKRQSRHSLFALDEKQFAREVFPATATKLARVDHGTVVEATEDDCPNGSRPQGGRDQCAKSLRFPAFA
jgi:hypothetical protein